MTLSQTAKHSQDPIRPFLASPGWFTDRRRRWLAQWFDKDLPLGVHLPLDRCQFVDVALMRLWQLCVDRKRTLLTIDEVDRHSGFPGFAEALVAMEIAHQYDTKRINMLGIAGLLAERAERQAWRSKGGKERAKSVSRKRNGQLRAGAGGGR